MHLSLYSSFLSLSFPLGNKHTHSLLLDECIWLLKKFEPFRLRHVYREVNRCANIQAKANYN